MPEPSTFRIPSSVSREDYLTALQPLLDLLGVTAGEIYQDIHIGSEGISFTAVARSTDRIEDDLPPGLVLAARPHEFAELAWHCSVRIA